MNKQEIFVAAVQLQLRTEQLARSVALYAPQIKEALCGPDPCPELLQLRRDFLLSCLEETEAEQQGVQLALATLRWAMGGEPPAARFRHGVKATAADGRGAPPPNGDPGDTKVSAAAIAERPANTAAEGAIAPINFRRFTKLREFYVVGRVVEVMAPLRGFHGTSLLRLEVLRAAQESGYEVAVYRQATVPALPPIQTAAEAPLPPQEVRVWVVYDLIASDRPTPEAALEQALGFLQMRCG
jgi:hypothetical protein